MERPEGGGRGEDPPDKPFPSRAPRMELAMMTTMLESTSSCRLAATFWDDLPIVQRPTLGLM